MPQNKIQFQNGMSLSEFIERYGTEAQCERCWITRRPNGFSASQKQRFVYGFDYIDSVATSLPWLLQVGCPQTVGRSGRALLNSRRLLWVGNRRSLSVKGCQMTAAWQ